MEDEVKTYKARGYYPLCAFWEFLLHALCEAGPACSGPKDSERPRHRASGGEVNFLSHPAASCP